MASTERVSDQVKLIRSNALVSNHRFFNMLAQGVIEHIEKSVPGLKIDQSAANVTKRGGTKVYTGTIIVANQNEHDAVDDKVRQTIDSLKNPANLLSVIK